MTRTGSDQGAISGYEPTALVGWTSGYRWSGRGGIVIKTSSDTNVNSSEPDMMMSSLILPLSILPR